MINENGFIDPENNYDDENNPDFETKIEILGRSKMVKFLAALDIFFSLYYAIFISWPYIFLSLLSILGYYGAKNFKRNYLMSYIVSCMIYTIIKIVLVANSSSNSIRLFNLISLFSELYLIYLVFRLYYKIKAVSGEVLTSLQGGWHPRLVSFVLY